MIAKRCADNAVRAIANHPHQIFLNLDMRIGAGSWSWKWKLEMGMVVGWVGGRIIALGLQMCSIIVFDTGVLNIAICLAG